jgi:hypothetical protein
MWICRQVQGFELQYEVGYYYPMIRRSGAQVIDYEFYSFCICENATEAGKVVNFLNGGNGNAPYMSLMDQLK